jgi:hypothetical protein
MRRICSPETGDEPQHQPSVQEPKNCGCQLRNQSEHMNQRGSTRPSKRERNNTAAASNGTNRTSETDCAVTYGDGANNQATEVQLTLRNANLDTICDVSGIIPSLCARNSSATPTGSTRHGQHKCTIVGEKKYTSTDLRWPHLSRQERAQLLSAQVCKLSEHSDRLLTVEM